MRTTLLFNAVQRIWKDCLGLLMPVVFGLIAADAWTAFFQNRRSGFVDYLLAILFTVVALLMLPKGLAVIVAHTKEEERDRQRRLDEAHKAYVRAIRAKESKR